MVPCLRKCNHTKLCIKIRPNIFLQFQRNISLSSFLGVSSSVCSEQTESTATEYAHLLNFFGAGAYIRSPRKLNFIKQNNVKISENCFFIRFRTEYCSIFWEKTSDVAQNINNGCVVDVFILFSASNVISLFRLCFHSSTKNKSFLSAWFPPTPVPPESRPRPPSVPLRWKRSSLFPLPPQAACSPSSWPPLRRAPAHLPPYPPLCT